MTLQEYLARNGLSQAAFARRIGVSQQAVQRYVDGKRVPKRALAKKIVEVTGGQVTYQDLLEAYTAEPASVA